MERYRIHLNDEAPRIGSGHRIVTVKSRGPKWVTVIYAPQVPRARGERRVSSRRRPVMVVRHRFPVAVWREIERKAEPLQKQDV